MSHRQTLAKSYWTLPLMVLLLLIVATLSLHIGTHPISLWQLSEILSDPTSIEYTILMQLRLPRIINAISIGGGLSLCGAILQGLFRNPLVEPYTLGISGGASLGVTLAIVLGLSTAFLTLPAFGFIGALVTILLVYANSYQRHGLSVQRMLLVGVMVSFMASSGVMLLLSVARAEQLSRIIFWTMGSLQESNPLIVWGML
uniref:FecCD family ABC transporter permease n=1 Tax=Porphyromonas sp. TaxID=1924944 RepID=UPI003A958137